MVLAASAEVEGCGGRAERKSPYAGASCSLTSPSMLGLEGVVREQRHTVDGLALGQVAVVLAGEQCIAVAAHDALDVAVQAGQTQRQGGTHSATYPYLTL